MEVSQEHVAPTVVPSDARDDCGQGDAHAFGLRPGDGQSLQHSRSDGILLLLSSQGRRREEDLGGRQVVGVGGGQVQAVPSRPSAVSICQVAFLEMQTM